MQTMNEPKIEEDIYEVASNIVREQIQHRQSVLLFLPGIIEIQKMEAAVKEGSCDIIILHSSINQEE